MQPRVTGAAPEGRRQVISDPLLTLLYLSRKNISNMIEAKRVDLLVCTSPREVPGCSSNQILTCDTFLQQWWLPDGHGSQADAPNPAVRVRSPTFEDAMPLTTLGEQGYLRDATIFCVSPSLPPFFQRKNSF